MSTELIEGGCLCGAMRYRITAAPLTAGCCHCRSCRLACGAPSVAWIVARSDAFAFTAGEPIRYNSSPEVARTFCGTCGTPLTYRHLESPDTVDVTTATLDRPDAFAPKRHVWLEHKIAWEHVDPALPQYARGSGDASENAT